MEVNCFVVDSSLRNFIERKTPDLRRWIFDLSCVSFFEKFLTPLNLKFMTLKPHNKCEIWLKKIQQKKTIAPCSG
jgi:hypothetical protein